MSKFKKYLSSEIGIEFKSCLYFFAILFFYSVYRIWKGSFYANIIIMAEMISSTYIMGYIQVFLLGNFDEAEQFTPKVGIASVGCSVIYTVTSFLCCWFNRNVAVTVLFFCYIVLCYICMFLVYKVKRDIDTEILNQELACFKKKER